MGTAPSELPQRLQQRRAAAGGDPKRSSGRTDWGAWPAYDGASAGLRDYWYPVAWSAQVVRRPFAVEVVGERLMLQRDAEGAVHALHDRCPHRGVPLSLGKEEFPGTVTCAYHAWTYRLSDGQLCAVITDGPDSPMCGKVSVRTYPTAEAIGLVWVFIGDREPHPLTDQLPEELVDAPDMAVGGRIEDRDGNWRYYAENGFDEGHAKYLHRTSYWRIFKTMPTWNKIHVERHGRWIYRVEDERHWDAEFPGLGHWTNQRWWKTKPKVTSGKSLGNTGANQQPDPYIAAAALCRLRLALAPRGAAHRLSPVHPLRVLRADRRRAHEVRRGDGHVRLAPQSGGVLRPLPRWRSAGCSTATSRRRITGWSR